MLRHLIATLLFAIVVLACSIATFAWLEEPATNQADLSEQHLRWLFASMVVAALAGLGLAYLLSRSILAPIHQLTNSVQRMTEGDFSARTAVDAENELGRLSQSLNEVAKQMESTLREQRRESIRLRTLLNGMQDGVCLTDGGGVIVLSNRAFDALFSNEATGQTLIDAVPHETIRTAVWTALRGSDVLETVEIPVQGKPRSLLVQATPLAEEGGIVLMIHDVTPLRRADRIRRDFVANASHELRTPLTAIRGFAETLRDGALEQPEQARRFVDVILRNAMRLQMVADDLLRLSKAEARTQDFDLRPVDVRNVLDDLALTFSEQAKQKSVVFRIDCTEHVFAHSNAVALDHMLSNLIHNALKVAPPGSDVSVSCHAREDHIALDVADQGPGIAEEHLDRIFERFYRVDRGRSADGGGTGLGLAIVKHLAERINAEVDVRSQQGQGSVFTIRLPVATR